MFNPFSGRLPGKRTVLSVLLVLALSYGAFIVGNTMNQSHSEGGETYEPHVYWDTPSYSDEFASVVSDISDVSSVAVSAAQAATAASEASSSRSLFSFTSFFGDVSAEGKGFTGDTVQEDMSAGRMGAIGSFRVEGG